MKLGSLIFSLQETHRRGITNERLVKYDGENWIVRICDDNDRMELQLVKCRFMSDKPEFVLLSCPSGGNIRMQPKYSKKLLNFGHMETEMNVSKSKEACRSDGASSFFAPNAMSFMEQLTLKGVL